MSLASFWKGPLRCPVSASQLADCSTQWDQWQTVCTILYLLISDYSLKQMFKRVRTRTQYLKSSKFYRATFPIEFCNFRFFWGGGVHLFMCTSPIIPIQRHSQFSQFFLNTNTCCEKWQNNRYSSQVNLKRRLLATLQKHKRRLIFRQWHQ